MNETRPVFLAYVFLIRGVSYRAREVLDKAIQDKAATAAAREDAHDALFALTKNGAAAAIAQIESGLSAHEKMIAREKVKEIRI